MFWEAMHNNCLAVQFLLLAGAAPCSTLLSVCEETMRTYFFFVFFMVAMSSKTVTLKIFLYKRTSLFSTSCISIIKILWCIVNSLSTMLSLG